MRRPVKRSRAGASSLRFEDRRGRPRRAKRAKELWTRPQVRPSPSPQEGRTSTTSFDWRSASRPASVFYDHEADTPVEGRDRGQDACSRSLGRGSRSFVLAERRKQVGWNTIAAKAENVPHRSATATVVISSDELECFRASREEVHRRVLLPRRRGPASARYAARAG